MWKHHVQPKQHGQLVTATRKHIPNRRTFENWMGLKTLGAQCFGPEPTAPWLRDHAEGLELLFLTLARQSWLHNLSIHALQFVSFVCAAAVLAQKQTHGPSLCGQHTATLITRPRPLLSDLTTGLSPENSKAFTLHVYKRHYCQWS